MRFPFALLNKQPVGNLLMRCTRHLVSCSVVLLAFLCWSGTAQAQPVTIQANTAPGDAFGHTVALAEPYLLVSANGENDNAGAVYVFRQTTRGWVQEARLTPPNAPVAHKFGHHLALDGQTIVIGEPQHPRPFPATGAVYIFERNVTGA